MAPVLPTKSAAAATSGAHSGCATTLRPGKLRARLGDLRRRECVVHHARAVRGDDLLRHAAAPQLGPQIFRHEPVGHEEDPAASGKAATMSQTLPEVTQTSDSAFTSAVLLM